VRWAREGIAAPVTTLRCQDDVERILETRTIRFSEASARIDPASEKLLDEVARALRPCVGSIIAVIGHTDAGGNQKVNLALSVARANAVRWELISRGIPADGLRAAGVGSKQPIAGLDPRDPANRRIEFSVISPAPIKPTPIDTPGPA
jgi:OOP family OmpA-OmpF porin